MSVLLSISTACVRIGLELGIRIASNISELSMAY